MLPLQSLSFANLHLMIKMMDRHSLGFFISMVSWGFDCYSIFDCFLNNETKMWLWNAECSRCSTVLSTSELSHHLAHWVAANLPCVHWIHLFFFKGTSFNDTVRTTPATDQSLTVINTKEQTASWKQTMSIVYLFSLLD